MFFGFSSFQVDVLNPVTMAAQKLLKMVVAQNMG